VLIDNKTGAVQDAFVRRGAGQRTSDHDDHVEVKTMSVCHDEGQAYITCSAAEVEPLWRKRNKKM
jgi:hypothetical protein